MGCCHGEDFGDQQDLNHLLLGSRARDSRPFPWKSSHRAAPGARRCCSTSFALLLHLRQISNNLGLCPSGVSLITGSLEHWYHPTAARFHVCWLLYLCEVSAVAVKQRLQVQGVLSNAPQKLSPSLLSLVVGLKDQHKPCRVLPGGDFW